MKRFFHIFVAAICTAAFCACTTAEVKKDIAVQLYSVRDLIGSPEKYAANHEAVLAELASYGYTAVEAANYSDGKFYGVSPEQFRSDVEAAGMKVLSSHCGKELSPEELASGDFTESMKWWDLCIAAHKAAGMQYIVTPWMRVPSSLKDLQTYCDYYNAIGKKCAENGMGYGYHNHDHEFVKVEGETMYDYMISHTDAEYVFFQMDVYWAVIGNASPVDYFTAYPGRFKVLHIKDNKEIGQSGMVGFDAIFNSFAVSGTEDYSVEVERYSTDEVMGSMKASADYLIAAPFVK